MRLAHLCPQLPSLENKQKQQGLIPEPFPQKALIILSDMHSIWKCIYFNTFIKKATQTYEQRNKKAELL